MGSKEQAALELNAIIKEYDLAPSTVGREIAGDPNLIYRMADGDKSITSKEWS